MARLEVTLNLASLEVTLYKPGLEDSMFMARLEVSYMGRLEVTLNLTSLEVTLYKTRREDSLHITRLEVSLHLAKDCQYLHSSKAKLLSTNFSAGDQPLLMELNSHRINMFEVRDFPSLKPSGNLIVILIWSFLPWPIFLKQASLCLKTGISPLSAQQQATLLPVDPNLSICDQKV